MPGHLTAGARRSVRLPLDWGCAKRARPGAAMCGDAEVVKSFSGSLLVGVLDGLGRGQEAALAAESAVRVLMRYGRQPLTGLVKRCHRTLMMTRGAALSLASFRLQPDQSVQLGWLGVGNVEGLLLRSDPEAKPAREHLPLHGGIVGYYLPRLRETTRPLQPGDTLILSTDGIRSDFEQELNLDQPAAPLAEAILERSFRGIDDALVLVARLATEPTAPATAAAPGRSEVHALHEAASAQRAARSRAGHRAAPPRRLQEPSHEHDVS
jgi:phosphoserine phosphatase RsbX